VDDGGRSAWHPDLIPRLRQIAMILAIVVTTSTGIALVCSKLIPYVFAVALSAWTLVYGEHEKKKAERLASTSVDAGT
jgi:hypothetical protein